jgi:hypothetical protein
MLRHIVFWKIKEEALGKSRAELLVEMRRQLESLSGLVPGLLHLEVGGNIQTGEMAADLCLYTEFADEAALESYQVHPQHQDVVSFIKQVISERRVVDYII